MKSIQEIKNKEYNLLQKASKQLYEPVQKNRRSGDLEIKKPSEFSAMEDILAYYNIPSVETPENLKEDRYISYILQKTGLFMRKIRLQGKWWKEVAMPIMVTTVDGDEYALIPDNSGGYTYTVDGQTKKLDDKMRSSLSDIAYVFYNPMGYSEKGMKAFAKFLCKSIKPSDIVAIIFISLVLEFCGLLLPYINQIVYNSVIPSGTSREIPGIIVLAVGSVVFSALIKLTRSISVTRIGSKMKIAGQSAVWNRLFQLPTSFFRKYDSGEIYNRANAVDVICEIIGGGLIPTALTALLSIIYLFQISQFASVLVLPSAFIIFLLIINIVIAGFLSVKQQMKTNEMNNQVTSLLYQFINGINKIRTSGAEVRAYSKWAECWKNMPVLNPLYVQISEIIAKTVSIGGSILLYYLAWKSKLSASSYIAFQTAFSAFFVSVMALADFGTQIGCLKPAVNMLRPILDENVEIHGERAYVEKLTGRIELNNVFFRYNEEMPYVLNGMNLNIEPGEYIGIVGSSGCGKSTLMRLLLGFETAQSGSVFYDGKDISGLDLPSLRRRIGIVLQSGSLFAGDIFSNISICAPFLTMEEAWDAAERAGVSEDIEKMPMGMFTMLSDDGAGISGGQKQRLLIARAIAANPDVLLFDEATSALDNRTQAIVVKTLKDMKCTRLVIAHRLSTIKECDRIIYLDKGEIVESGTYEELMKQNGRFAQMAIRQLAEQ